MLASAGTSSSVTDFHAYTISLQRLCLAFCSFAAALSLASPLHAAAYNLAEVAPLKFASGITMQSDVQDGIVREVTSGLQESGRFDQILTVHADDSTASLKHAVLITATVTQYSAGSATKRALIGFGAGATKLTVHIVFTDAQTGRLLTEGDAHGAVKAGSLLGGAGNNEDAQKHIAAEVRHLAETLQQ